MDFKQPAKTTRGACRAVLLPEGILQESRGMSRERCPGQVPHPWPGKKLFVHMADGKPANPASKGFAIAPSWCIHGKNESCFSCKPFLSGLCISSPPKTLTTRATPTHVAVVWAEEAPCSKPGILAQNTDANGEQGWHVSHGELLFLGFTHTRQPHLHCVTLAREYSKGRWERSSVKGTSPFQSFGPQSVWHWVLTVSCLTVCYPLALNRGKTAQIQAQFKITFHGHHSKCTVMCFLK